MTPLRYWVALLACGSFAAGGVSGFWLAAWRAPAAEPAAEQDWGDELIARYELRPDQARSLRIVLQKDRADENAVRRSIEWGQLPEELQRRVLGVHRKTRELIRVAVLDDKQRVLYDRDTEPSATPSTGTMTGSAVRPIDR